MKTYRIEWRQFINSFPEVGDIKADTAEEAVSFLMDEEGDDIVIDRVEEQ